KSRVGSAKLLTRTSPCGAYRTAARILWKIWWALKDLNLRPMDYESRQALSIKCDVIIFHPTSVTYDVHHAEPSETFLLAVSLRFAKERTERGSGNVRIVARLNPGTSQKLFEP